MLHVALEGLPKPLTYLGPSHVGLGWMVECQLRNRLSKGWVIESQAIKDYCPETESSQQLSLVGGADYKLKTITKAWHCFNPALFRLFEWMSDYYACPIFDVIDCAVPKRSPGRTLTSLKLSPDGETQSSNFDELKTSLSRAPKQQLLIEKLVEAKGPATFEMLGVESSSFQSVAKALEKKGLITLERISASEVFDTKVPEQSEGPGLNQAQKNVASTLKSAIDDNSYRSFLLHGVTGSGKTEVYIEAILHALSKGKTGLIIVPEIALTPQMLERFQTRLGTRVGVLHSQIGASSRWRDWQAILRGDIKVVLGARSAVFAPLPNLGIIVVDEEHEQSYKQSDGLRYQGRDVAVLRANFEKAVVVLGSATPSFETILNVKRERYGLLELKERATKRPLPDIEMVDMTRVSKKSKPSPSLSPKLYEALKENLERGEQSVVLFNKRGYASYLQCDSCGEVSNCPMCSLSFTYHKSKHRLICHHCGYTEPPKPVCPSCRDPKTTRIDSPEAEKRGELNHRGSGTEKVYEEFRELFPSANIVRMDRDTTSNLVSYEHILEQMKSGTADILLGTQMIAKGHDLPGVTLVGIIDADVGLHLPDFRSSERVYQLLTQAAGRAGRGDKPGRVFIQSRQLNHPAILASKGNRFKSFARYELEFREKLFYPPYSKLLRIVVSSESARRATQSASLVRKVTQELIDQLEAESEKETKDSSDQISLMGPAPAHFERLNGRFRWHLLLKSNSASKLSRIANSLSTWKKSNPKLPEFRLTRDIDPFDML